MQLDWQDLIDHTLRNEPLRKAYVWAPFAGGSSNSIFLGQLKQHQDPDSLSSLHAYSPNGTHTNVILRINAPANDTPGVCRAREAAILDKISPYAWAPQIIVNEPEQGWCLMRYYNSTIKPQSTLSKGLATCYHKQMIDALNELHAIEININRATDLTINYQTLLNETYRPIATAKNDAQALSWIQSIKEDLNALPILPKRLVHHDLHLGNLILSKRTAGDDTAVLTILDWEYAAIGNPWFDASCLSRYLSLPAHTIFKLNLFSSLDQSTFTLALEQANNMTKNLEQLWYKTRE